MDLKKPSIIKKITHKIYEKTIIFNKNFFGKIDDKLIVFSSEPDFSDNSRVLFEYLQKNDFADKYKFVWIVKESDKFRDTAYKYKNTVFISKNDEYMYQSREVLENLLKAKFYFGTHIRQKRLRKANTGQTIVNLWHGCGFKDTQEMPWNDAFDYMLVPGDVFIETKSKFFGCDKGMILPIGYPRYDLFFTKSLVASEFASLFKQNPQTKLIIWMPTFRKTDKNKYPEEQIDYDYPIPSLRSDDDMLKLDIFCRKKNVVILIKKHLYQKNFGIDSSALTNIVFIDESNFSEKNVQMYEFLPFTDALISDYSSISIDYLLLDKPIGFTLDDYDMYKKTRGFVFDDPRDYMPGNHIYNFKELCSFINDISENKDKYSSERKNVKQHTNKYDNNFCKRITERFEL